LGLVAYFDFCHEINGSKMKNKIPMIMFAASLAVCSAVQASVVATDATYGVFDASQGSRTLAVSTHGTIADLNLTLVFAKCDGPPVPPTGSNCLATGNAFNDEIYFWLTAPNGTTVGLIDAASYFGGTAGSGKVTLTLDDEAVQAVGGPVLASGTFRPSGLLAAFDGMDMFGNWSLTAGDTDAGDPLTYFSSSLDIAAVSQALPEPGSFLLFGIGLAALCGRWRRHA
jgi:hypothetical protein